MNASREEVDSWLAAKLLGLETASEACLLRQLSECLAADQLLPLLRGDLGLKRRSLVESMSHVDGLVESLS